MYVQKDIKYKIGLSELAGYVKKDQSDMGNVCRDRGGWGKNQITVA